MSRNQSPKPPGEHVMSAYGNIINHYFPHFWKDIGKFSDSRVQGRCRYKRENLLATEFARCFSSLQSHQVMDAMFSGDQTVENIYRLCGEKSDQVARGDTINYYLKSLPTKHLRSLLDKMVFHLLKNKCIECCREPLANTLLIGADGTGLRSTKVQISHSTTKKHRNGKFLYHQYVLLLAFVSPNGVMVPLACEFIENGKDYNPEFKKQDCEHKAEVKTFKSLKKHHPMLPVTMLMDALSLDYTILDLCRTNGWKFCISYRKDVAKGLDKEIKNILESMKCEKKVTLTTDVNGTTIRKTYKWSKLSYSYGAAKKKDGIAIPITYAEMECIAYNKKNEEVEKTKYERITNHKLNSGNIEAFFKYIGRTRWVEENQGFNEMKNLGLNIEHAYGSKGEASVNHFLIQMTAFLIMQLAHKTDFFDKVVQAFSDQRIQKEIRKLFNGLAGIAQFFLDNLRNRLLEYIDTSQWRIKWNTT